MPADLESHRGSWLRYATAFGVLLPVLYVLSSGPARCINWKKTSSFSFGQLFAKDDLRVPYRQGSFVLRRWATPIRFVFLPLEMVPDDSVAGKTLNWYWDLFGTHWHYADTYPQETSVKD